jgi:hypothetical protein
MCSLVLLRCLGMDTSEPRHDRCPVLWVRVNGA